MTRALRHWHLVAVLVLALLAWQPVVTAPAERFNADVLSSAVKVYAILRGINAAISVAKETEIGLQLVGSVTTQPAMVLDPIDETVARVADAVFALAAASGVLALALTPVAQIGAVIAALGVAMMWGAGIRPASLGRLNGAGRSFAGFGLVLCLAVPLVYGLGGQLGVAWTDEARIEAQQMLNGSAESLSSAVEQAQAIVDGAEAAPGRPADAASIWSQIIDGARAAGDTMGASVRDAVPTMEAVQDRGGEILESSIRLIAIYAFQLIVLPLVLLWGLFILARRMLP